MHQNAIHQTPGGRSTVNFGTMLSQLGDLHQREIEEAVDSWIQENLRLQCLVRDLEAKLQIREIECPGRDAPTQRGFDSVMGEEKASTYDMPTKAQNAIHDSSAQNGLSKSMGKQMMLKQASMTKRSSILNEAKAPGLALAGRINSASELQGASMMQIQAITNFVNADKNAQNRNIQRFRALMELDDSASEVRPEHLRVALEKKSPHSVDEWNGDRLKDLIGEFKRISKLLGLSPESESQLVEDAISIETFVNVILLPDLAQHVTVDDSIKAHRTRNSSISRANRPSVVHTWAPFIAERPSFVNTWAPFFGKRADSDDANEAASSNRKLFRSTSEDDILDFQRDLLKEDVTDVLAELSSKRQNTYFLGAGKAGHQLAKLNAFVGFIVVLSLVLLPISLDVAPLSPIWIALEVIISGIFVIEIVVKMKTFGCKAFFRGSGRHFNMFDMFVTSVSIADATVSVLAMDSGSDISTGRLVLVARALRLARVTRLMKVLEMPILKELATTLLAFVIAIRTLAWMLLLFSVSLIVVGIMVRISVGPSPGQDLLSECPAGDKATSADPPQCKIHYLYGEEFFGNTIESTFTLFRCIMGDCTTRSGKSLAAEFSAGFGLRFDVVYVIGMMVVFFGFFNLINAIFVESVISGLKINDVRNHYLRTYDTDYVTGKLVQLTQRIHTICRPQLIENSGSPGSEEGSGSSIVYTKEDFFNIVKDELASNILDDLDISRFNRERLFDIFDVNGNGTVSEAQFMNTLMQLRGEAQKSDVLQSSAMIRCLRNRIDRVHEIVLNNQCQMLQNQRYLLRDIIVTSLGEHLPHLMSPLSGQAGRGPQNVQHAATLTRRRVIQI